jgi:hypothetical protein
MRRSSSHVWWLTTTPTLSESIYWCRRTVPPRLLVNPEELELRNDDGELVGGAGPDGDNRKARKAAPAEGLRGPEDPDGGVAVDGFQRRHRGVEADACGEEHGLAAVDRGGELLLGGSLQVQPDRADAGAVQGCAGALVTGQPADLVAGRRRAAC